MVHDGVDAEHHGGDTEWDDHPLEAAVGTDAERERGHGANRGEGGCDPERPHRALNLDDVLFHVRNLSLIAGKVLVCKRSLRVAGTTEQ